MRSRYTAYARGEPQGIDWLVTSHDPRTRGRALREDVAAWARSARFTGLEVKAVERGGPEDREGFVTFVARFEEAGKKQTLSERSRFRRDDEDRWVYVDGTVPRRRGTRLDRFAPRDARDDT